MRSALLVTATVIVVLLLVLTAFVAVDRTEFVYVTQFGKHVATYDGATDDAGLHFKLPWPIQTVQRLDRRLQVLDLAGAELLTHDPKGRTIDKTLTISAYVCWQIADRDGVDRFIRAVGTTSQAEAILRQRISSRLGAEIGNMQLDDLISVTSGQQAEERMDRLSARLLTLGDADAQGATAREGLRESARNNLGIDVVDIRLRRFNYPPQVRSAIFERIRSERYKKVADYRSEGEQLAENIKSQAEYEARTILAEARATEERLKGKAEAEADNIRNEAHKKDVAFYTFLKKLEGYQRILGDNKTVLLLSSHRDLFDVLFKPPSPENGAAIPKPIAGPISSGQPNKSGGQ
jgi:membrane protease subunit HflC